MYNAQLVSLTREAAKAYYLYSAVPPLFKEAIFRLPCAIGNGEPDLPYNVKVSGCWALLAEDYKPRLADWNGRLDSFAFVDFLAEVASNILSLFFLSSKQQKRVVRTFCEDLVIYYRLYDLQRLFFDKVFKGVGIGE